MTTRADNPSLGSTVASHPARHSLAPELALLATILLWSSTFIVTKDQLDVFSPFSFIFIRFLLMVAMAFALMAIREHGFPVPHRRDWGRFAAAGLGGYTFYQIGFVLGLDHTSPFASSLLIATSPLFTTVVLAAIGERSPLLSWVGLAVAVAGVVIFLFDKRGGDRSLEGDLLSIMAALSFAVYNVVNRPLARNYSPAVYTAWAMGLGAVPLLLVSLPDAIDQDWGAISAGSWVAVVYMVIFPVYIAYMLWNFGIQHRGAALASSFGLIVPVLSGVLSAIVFSEQFGGLKIAGGLVALLGLLTMRLGAARRSIPGSEN